MSDETIRLRDLVHSLASTMLVTTKYLDQAVAELQNIYTTSPDGALSGLTPPRFTLDDMTVDLSFVVAEVRQSTEQPEAPTPAIQLTENQANSLASLLRNLEEDDRQKLAEYEAKVAEVKARQAEFDRNIGEQRARLTAELREIEIEAKQVEEERRRAERTFPRNPRVIEQLQKRMQQLQARHGQIKFELDRLRFAERPPDLTEERPRAPGGEGPGYVEMWDAWLAAYLARKEEYAEAFAAFQDERPLGELSPPTTMPRLLGSALAALDGRSTFPKKKVDDTKLDFLSTDRALAKIAELSAARAASGIRVKVDPESIKEAPAGALQSLHLTFRSQSQERVNVEGEDVDIER